MTRAVETIGEGESLHAAAQRMRDADIGDLVVLDQHGELCGILTDRDIVVRALAESGDLSNASVGEHCSRDLETLSPDDTLHEAVDRMAGHAVRRIPVVDGGEVVGIVSLGDLAEARDAESALGQISGARPNT